MNYPPVKLERFIQQATVAFCKDQADGKYSFSKDFSDPGTKTAIYHVSCHCSSGEPDGPWHLTVNNRDYIKGAFKEGKEDGEWNFYHVNGRLWINAYIRKGIMHGPAKYWYESGTIQKEINYVDGYIEGKSTLYYEDGHKWLECTYKHGLYHGKFTQWYGKGLYGEGYGIYMLLNFYEGKLHGSQVYYHDNGVKHMEVIYESDEVVSGKLWDENGNERPFNKHDEPKPRYDKFH